VLDEAAPSSALTQFDITINILKITRYTRVRQDLENSKSCRQEWKIQNPAGKIWKILEPATHHSLTRCSNSRQITHQLAGPLIVRQKIYSQDYSAITKKKIRLHCIEKVTKVARASGRAAAILIRINRFEFKTVMVVDLSFDRLSQNCLELSRSPGMFKLFMIVDDHDSLFSCFAPLR